MLNVTRIYNSPFMLQMVTARQSFPDDGRTVYLLCYLPLLIPDVSQILR